MSCPETVKKGPRRPFLTIKSPGRERPMGTGAALRASVVRQRRTIRHCAPRNVFSATYTPPPKMIAVPFAPIGRETLRGFFDKLKDSSMSCPFLFSRVQSAGTDLTRAGLFNFCLPIACKTDTKCPNVPINSTNIATCSTISLTFNQVFGILTIETFPDRTGLGNYVDRGVKIARSEALDLL